MRFSEHDGGTTRDRLSGVMRAVWARFARRAWSRAGAVAAVVRSGVPRRVLGMSSRLLLLVAGSALISVSVSVTIWNQLGPGPLDVFIGAVRIHTGLPMSVAVWVTVGSLIAAAWVLGRRPGFGTVVSPFLIGPMLQASLAVLDSFETPSSLLVRVALHLLAIAGIGIGAGALIVSGLGAGSGELFAGAASDRVRRPESRVRPFIELSWIVLGVGLGGPAGLGTVLVAVFIAPAVAWGYRSVDSSVVRSKRRLGTGHDALRAYERRAVERDLAHR